MIYLYITFIIFKKKNENENAIIALIITFFSYNGDRSAFSQIEIKRFF